MNLFRDASKLRSISWATFSRTFSRPFKSAEGEWRHRNGVVLRASWEGGEISFGEASPLPGVSRENLDQVVFSLREENLSSFLAQGREVGLLPCLQFAFDSLLLSSVRFSPVTCNAILGVDENDFVSAYAQGFRTFKVKVSQQNIEGRLQAVKDWHARVSFRLDPNGSVPPSAFKEFAGKNIEYVEGVKAPGLPYAVDALDFSEAQAALSDDSVSALVVKPTVIGGLMLGMRLLSRGKKVIFSSALETEIGRRAILQFVGALGLNQPMGLATGHFFEQNYFSDESVFVSLPAIGPGEIRWLEGLAWRQL